MIDYTDASDLFFVWLKRALLPRIQLCRSPDADGLQEKAEEIIVKKGGVVQRPPYADVLRLQARAGVRRRL